MLRNSPHDSESDNESNLTEDDNDSEIIAEKDNFFEKIKNTNFGYFITFMLSIGGSSIMTMLLTMFTFFGKIAERVGFLPFFPFISEILNFTYQFPKLLLKPIPLKFKIPFGFLMIVSFLASSLALGSYILYGFFHITAFAALMPYVPILMVGAVTIGAGLTLFAFGMALNDYVAKPWRRTSQATLTLVSRLIKTICLTAMASSMIPLFLAIGSVVLTASIVNPFTAGPTAIILFSIIVGAAVALTIRKIIKVKIQRHLQNKALSELINENNSLYQYLGVSLKHFQGKSHRDTLKLLNKKLSEKENKILNKRSWALLSKTDKEALQKVYRAYEVLKNKRSREHYEVLYQIKNNQFNTKYAPNELFGNNTSFKPLIWLKYKFKQPDLNQANMRRYSYLIATNSHLKTYFNTHDKNRNNNSASFNRNSSTSIPIPSKQNKERTNNGFGSQSSYSPTFYRSSTSIPSSPRSSVSPSPKYT